MPAVFKTPIQFVIGVIFSKYASNFIIYKFSPRHYSGGFDFVLVSRALHCVPDYVCGIFNAQPFGFIYRKVCVGLIFRSCFARFKRCKNFGSPVPSIADVFCKTLCSDTVLNLCGCHLGECFIVK